MSISVRNVTITIAQQQVKDSDYKLLKVISAAK